MDLASIDFPRAFVLGAYACWLSVAVVNNIRDRGTNVHLLGVMFSMTLLDDEPLLASGLKHRAIRSPAFHGRVLTLVVAAQIVVALLLHAAWVLTLARWLGLGGDAATGVANLALCGFGAIWVFFLSGGLWFGYWMKQAPVQQVHLSLVLFTLGALILVNL